MYEFLFESCILSVWTFVLFISLFHFYLRFYDPFLRSEFGLHVPCRVKITILTTLAISVIEKDLLESLWCSILHFKLLTR